eukprot:CAMPEP_0113907064 /NCGR_PEP_ID=MMETSP0780_2-20120614/25224_1 /TAXON_ID=652834 /ORGANISM="Palpitomonas bilix" /LENGTH=378 /DNA_ID=CAMNT_0000901991 /DNA_START=529 /DNA_END=1665 /DNA_ORIENTATION=- /assembly_acc=CAM_ASM_000599
MGEDKDVSPPSTPSADDRGGEGQRGGTKEGEAKKERREITFWDYFKKQDEGEESLPAPAPAKRWGQAVAAGAFGGMLFGGAIGISRARKLNAARQEVFEQQQQKMRGGVASSNNNSGGSGGSSAGSSNSGGGNAKADRLAGGVKGLGGPKGSGRAAAAYPALFSRHALSYGGRFALFTAIFSGVQELVAYNMPALTTKKEEKGKGEEEVGGEKREEREGKDESVDGKRDVASSTSVGYLHTPAPTYTVLGSQVEAHEHPVALTCAGAVTAFLFRPVASLRTSLLSSAIGGGLGLMFSAVNIQLKKIQHAYEDEMAKLEGGSGRKQGKDQAEAKRQEKGLNDEEVDARIEETLAAFKLSKEKIQKLQKEVEEEKKRKKE